eukprot:755647-Rhodomonas_salina.1
MPGSNGRQPDERRCAGPAAESMTTVPSAMLVLATRVVLLLLLVLVLVPGALVQRSRALDLTPQGGEFDSQ